jgi:hypothetical protein
MWTGVVVWLVAVLAGMGVLMRYKNAPGATASAPIQWPAESRLSRSPERPTLIMLAHPHCPCTRASLAELSKLVARLPGRLTVHLLFIRPRGVDVGWEATDLWRRALEIPGAVVKVDDDGREAELFGARTSGDTLVYDPSGHLLFHGGITSSRGHEGDNTGRSRIVSLLTTGAADKSESAVYGCALTSDASP